MMVKPHTKAATLLFLPFLWGCFGTEVSEEPALRSSCFDRPSPQAEAYFQSHYMRRAAVWYVLGPFPSPLDPVKRDLLLSEGGEQRAEPSLLSVTIPPRVKESWRVVTPYGRDLWIPGNLRTRYCGYVPLRSGKGGEGAETALAVTQLALDEGFYRLLLKPWGTARLTVNTKAVIDRVQFENFFGQKEAFCKVRRGKNRFLVKIENSAYNRAAQAESIFGSWGFYLSIKRACKLTEGLFLDIPFVADNIPEDKTVKGKLALRQKGEATEKKVNLTLECGSSQIQLSCKAPLKGRARFFPFVLPVESPLLSPGFLQVKKDNNRLLRLPLNLFPKRDTLLRRALVSPIDGTLQPYVLYLPPSRAKPPLLLYIHGQATTEEEIAAWPSGALELAMRKGVPICAPRAREKGLLSGQAETDILLSSKQAANTLGIPHRSMVIMGSGSGGLCALKLACRFPGLFRGVVVAPKNPFENKQEKAFAASIDRSLGCMVENLKNQHILVLYREPGPRAKTIRRALEEAGARVHLVTQGKKRKPFYGKKFKKAFDSLLGSRGRSAPKEVSFTTASPRWSEAWWIKLAKFTEKNGPAHLEAAFKDRSKLEIQSKGAAKLFLLLKRLPFPVPEKLSIVWNGQEVFSGDPGAGPGLGVSLPGTNGIEEPKHVFRPLNELLRKPHTSVVPSGERWKWIASEILRNKPLKARFGRNVGAWREKVVSVKEWKSKWRSHPGFLPVQNPAGEKQKKPPNNTKLPALNPVWYENLILLGGPDQNFLVKRLSQSLPLKLTGENLALGKKAFSLKNHVVLFAFCRKGRLAAILAGEPLGRFAAFYGNSPRNPFAHPERFQGICVWRFIKETESFEKALAGEQIRNR